MYHFLSLKLSFSKLLLQSFYDIESYNDCKISKYTNYQHVQYNSFSIQLNIFYCPLVLSTVEYPLKAGVQVLLNNLYNCTTIY